MTRSSSDWFQTADGTWIKRLLDGGTKPTLAKLSLARMIAATVLRMWKDEEEYDPGRGGPLTQTRKG